MENSGNRIKAVGGGESEVGTCSLSGLLSLPHEEELDVCYQRTNVSTNTAYIARRELR
jgi:hypothetical protein